MAYPQASPITLTTRQQTILQQIVRRPTSSQGLVKRIRLILAAAGGTTNTQIGQQLQLSRGTVRQWRSRWGVAFSSLVAAEAEGISDKHLTQLMISVLSQYLSVKEKGRGSGLSLRSL